MGNLVDHFIIRLKPGVDPHDHETILSKLPEEYRDLYRYVSQQEGSWISLDAILDRSKWDADEDYYPCFDLAQEYLSHHRDCQIKFACRYRGESLLQFLRILFFDTLLILENVNDWNKENIFTVVTGDVITEDNWLKNPSQDQDCVQQVIKNFRDAGFTVIAQDGL